MGLHSKCARAYECRWGSDSVPGTCGFTSCQEERLKRKEERIRQKSELSMLFSGN